MNWEKLYSGLCFVVENKKDELDKMRLVKF